MRIANLSAARAAGVPIKAKPTPTSCSWCKKSFDSKEMRLREGDAAYHGACQREKQAQRQLRPQPEENAAYLARKCEFCGAVMEPESPTACCDQRAAHVHELTKPPEGY